MRYMFFEHFLFQNTFGKNRFMYHNSRVVLYINWRKFSSVSFKKHRKSNKYVFTTRTNHIHASSKIRHLCASSSKFEAHSKRANMNVFFYLQKDEIFSQKILSSDNLRKCEILNCLKWFWSKCIQLNFSRDCARNFAGFTNSTLKYLVH